jgi:Tfp pilus assembly protein PilZ
MTPPRDKPGPFRAMTPRAFRKVTPLPARRRDRRYVLPIPVLLTLSKHSIEATTGDVSYGGMFVVTDERLGLGQLAQVELLLPPAGALFDAPAKLVYARPALAKDERAGVGVEFYGLGRDAKLRWDTFIDHLRSAHPESASRFVQLGHAEPTDEAYPRTEKQVGALRVHVRGVRDLDVMLGRDLSRGTAFFALDSASRLKVGDEIAVHVVHPLADDFFELMARVRRVVVDVSVNGLDVEFLDLDDERRARFADFIEDGQAWIYDDESLGEG